MFDKIKQLYELKKQADVLKKELESEVLDIESGDYKVRINGNQKIISLEVPADFDTKKLQEVLNKAIQEAQKAAAKRMQGSLGLGNLQEFLKG